MPERLKKEWTRVAFGDVVVNRRDQIIDRVSAGIERIVGLEDLTSGDLRIQSWKGIDGSPSFRTLFKPGQTLFGKRRAYLRKVAVANFEGLCTQNILVLESKHPDMLLPELLPFLCSTDAFFEHAIATSEGSLFPNASWNALAKYEFALPPMEEQRRIAEVLRAVQDCTETLELAIGRMSAVRNGFFTHLILGPHASEFYGELSNNLLPSEWRLVPVCELVSALITKGATPSAELKDVDTGIPFLKVYNLTFDGTLDFSIDPTFITQAGHLELQRSIVQPGDILMNIVGPPLGKVSLVPSGFPECNINQAIARYRPVRDGLSMWLTRFMLSSLAQNWLAARSKKTSGQRNLTLETCRELPVPVPPDNAIREIMDQLAIIDASLIGIKTRLVHVNSLRRNLMETMLEIRGV